MAYSPINLPMFIAAYAGTMYGITANTAAITDPTTGDYANAAIVAGAFAQACDIAWDNSASADQLEVQMMQTCCENYWTSRTAGPAGQASFALNGSWSVPAGAIVALIKAAELYMTAQGITPPAWNSGGSSTITVTGDLSGTAQPLTAADLTVNESTTAPGGLFLVKNAGNTVAGLGTESGESATKGALYLFLTSGGVPAGTNYSLLYDGSTLHVNSITGGVQIESDTTGIAFFSPTNINLGQPLYGFAAGEPLLLGDAAVTLAATGMTSLNTVQQQTPSLTVGTVAIGVGGATLNFGNMGGAKGTSATIYYLDLSSVTTGGNSLTLENGSDSVQIQTFMNDGSPHSNLFVVKCQTNHIAFACGFG